MVRARTLTSGAVLFGWGGLFAALAFLPDTGVQAFFGSLAAIYVVALVALVGGFFWARWFARGVGWWGTLTGAMLMITTGVGAVLLAFTLTHAALCALLHHGGVAARYDGRKDWRERWSLDEAAARKVGGMVTNVGTMLPYVAFYAFFPRQAAAGAILALVLAAVGLGGIVRNRTWGIFAVAAGGVALVSSAVAGNTRPEASLIGVLLVLAVSRFVPQMVRWMRTAP